MRFQIRLIGVALAAWFSLACHGATQDNVHRLIYDPATGNLSLDNEGADLTALEIISGRGFFTGTRPSVISGLFDVFEPTKLFRLLPTGFGDTDFGPAMRPGLTLDLLQSDLRVNGALLPSGSLGQVVFSSEAFRPRILHYDPATGAMRLDPPEITGDDSKLTSVVIDSTAGIFTGERPASLTNAFDVFRAQRVFKMDLSGFNSFDLGHVATTGLSDSALASDLCIAGSMVGGGSLSGVHLNSGDGPILRMCATNPDQGGLLPPPSSATVIYDPATGRVDLSVIGPQLMSLEIETATDLFRGAKPDVLTSFADLFSPRKLFKQDPNGFGSLAFGEILPRGLGNELSAIRATGTLFPSGETVSVSFRAIVIPEPTASLAIGLGMIASLHFARRHRLARGC